MLEPTEGVKQDAVETPATEEVVETTPETTQEESTEATETEETPAQTETGEAQAEAVDERGVPWKNVAFEYKRKQEDLAEKLPTLIKDAISQSIGQTQPQPKYSVEQLEAFATETDNPTYKSWAKGEIRKLEEERMSGIIAGEFDKREKKIQGDIQRKSSFDYVAKNYSEAFNHDAQGNLAGWNNNHPITIMIGNLMKDPRFGNDPEGLVAAADIAYGRYARSQGNTSLKKATDLKRTVKNLQKKTLIEGGGKDTSMSVPAHRAAIDRLKQTGSIKDAQAAISEVLRARRASEEKE